ncbi:alpha-hydroxy acid oxidase [Sphingomonas flavalba]|uniref:alpha-hydroxy acid oxidase n=1 Tax=Sphingomonas flavalba TaxID=2559804 RepID=UPI00109DFF7C|nr:alpha-hydroxy acid oxidase [Sphingomonas flavalba]
MTNQFQKWLTGGYTQGEEDPGRVALDSLRAFEESGAGRRQFMAALGALAAGYSVNAVAQTIPGPRPFALDATNGKQYPPQHGMKVMGPVNIHEIEQASARTLDVAHFEYVSSGSEDEYTLTDNIRAYELTRLRQHVGVDVSRIDTSVEILGQKLAYPIILDPTTKNTVVPDGDRLAAIGAHDANAFYGVTNALAFIDDLKQAGQCPNWWICQLGHRNRQLAQTWAKQYTDAGAAWLGVTVDHPYTPNRDRNIRNKFHNYRSGVLAPVIPSLSWEYISWLKEASPLPVVVKGILNAEDAAAAVKYGADGIVVSNHGGRAYDGAVPTLVALPECVEAVRGRIPVMLDGGIRRGSDVLKALALGAKAVMVGRPPAWGVAAFGSVGVQRVMELLAAELTVSMGIAGAPNLAAVKRGMVRLPWEEYRL